MDDEDLLCLEIHRPRHDDEYEDLDLSRPSDFPTSFESNFDEIFRKYKPPPVKIDPEKHKIVEIAGPVKPCYTSYASALWKVNQEISDTQYETATVSKSSLTEEPIGYVPIVQNFPPLPEKPTKRIIGESIQNKGVSGTKREFSSATIVKGTKIEAQKFLQHSAASSAKLSKGRRRKNQELKLSNTSIKGSDEVKRNNRKKSTQNLESVESLNKANKILSKGQRKKLRKKQKNGLMETDSQTTDDNLVKNPTNLTTRNLVNPGNSSNLKEQREKEKVETRNHEANAVLSKGQRKRQRKKITKEINKSNTEQIVKNKNGENVKQLKPPCYSSQSKENQSPNMILSKNQEKPGKKVTGLKQLKPGYCSNFEESCPSMMNFAKNINKQREMLDDQLSTSHNFEAEPLIANFASTSSGSNNFDVQSYERGANKPILSARRNFFDDEGAAVFEKIFQYRQGIDNYLRIVEATINDVLQKKSKSVEEVLQAIKTSNPLLQSINEALEANRAEDFLDDILIYSVNKIISESLIMEESVTYPESAHYNNTTELEFLSSRATLNNSKLNNDSGLTTSLDRSPQWCLKQIQDEEQENRADELSFLKATLMIASFISLFFFTDTNHVIVISFILIFLKSSLLENILYF